MTRSDHRGRHFVWVVLLLGLCLQGCVSCKIGSPPPVTAPPDGGERSTITIHTWQTLTQPPQAPWAGPRSGLYTYVLVGDVGGTDATSANPQVVEARRALEELIKEVQTGQRAQAVADKDLLPLVNQFCLPARGYTAGRFELKQYDFELANAYLRSFKLALQELPDLGQRLETVGPFLVATRKPVGEIVARAADGGLTIDTGAPVLLVDLSGRHPKAMPAYVNDFKKAVRDIDLRSSARLEPLRPAFASWVLKGSEALPFVAEAYAGTRKMFDAPADKPQ